MRAGVLGAVFLFFCVTATADDVPRARAIAGTGRPGYTGDGFDARRAELNQPFGVVYDAAGDLYLADTFNHVVRKVDGKSGTITTVAGDGRKGFAGDGGPATKAWLDEPYGLALGADNDIYVADRLNRRVRKIDGKTGLITTVLGDGRESSAGDGGPAARAGLVEPNGVAVDLARSLLYVADVGANRVRVVDLKSGTVNTFAGDGRNRSGGDGGPATSASVHGARAVAVAPDGAVYLVERQGNRVRRVDPATHVITTVAGMGRKGYSGDGGPATAATFNGPKEIAVDTAGNLFVVDTENHAVRRVDARTQVITTVVGDGRAGPQGEGQFATAARLDRPHGVAVRPDGVIAIGDTENHRVLGVFP